MGSEYLSFKGSACGGFYGSYFKSCWYCRLPSRCSNGVYLIMENLDHITTLEELLKVTIADVRAVKADKGYKFDVREWHESNLSSGKCAVCVGGAVIAKTLGADPEVNLAPVMFPPATYAKLKMLDELRCSTVSYHMYSLAFPMHSCVYMWSLQDMFKDVNRDKLRDGHLTAWNKLYKNVKEMRI